MLRFAFLLLLLPLLSLAAECEDGSVLVYAVGETATIYGAESDAYCAQFCFREVALPFIPADPGNCRDQGFPYVAFTQETEVAGALVPVPITIYSTVVHTMAPTQAPPCETGSLSAFAAGEAAQTFGAESDVLCAEFCVPEAALQFLPNAQAGRCHDQGFPNLQGASQEVQLPGTSAILSVTMYRTSDPPTNSPTTAPPTTAPLPCEEGSVSAFAVGEAAETFGAQSAESCAEFCIPERALEFLPTAEVGRCHEQGYPEKVVESQQVQLPGSSTPLSVTIYGPPIPICQEGYVSAYGAGEAATEFGAESSALCSQFCTPELALQLLPNAVGGTCEEQGYTVEVVASREVELPGSPAPLVVTIYARQVDVDQCGEGSVSVYATGPNAQPFGAEGDNFCAEICVSRELRTALPNVAEGLCSSMGFTIALESLALDGVPGSSQPVTVTLYMSTSNTVAEETTSSTMDIETSSEVTSLDHPDPSSFEGPCVDCEEYVALSAEEKLDRIWTKIMAYEYEELPTNWLHSRTNPTNTEVINNFPDKSRVNMIFDRVSDERPPNFPRMLHEYGSIAKVAFVPTPGNNFTGLYEEGNEFGILRVTFCSPFNGERAGRRVLLAFAAKFFRDGMHSSNIPTCEGPDREWLGRDPQGFSVFHHVVHTSSMITAPIDAFFANAQNGTGPLSIADNTWYTQDGTPVEDPRSPLIIHFFPNEQLNTKDTYQEDFRRELPEIPVGSKLYTAYTPVDEMGNPTICNCHSTPEGDIPCFNRDSLMGMCNLVELGSIVSRSQFVHSDYGDNGILFKHYRSCQEDRKYCRYNQPVPEIDSTFTKSSDPSGTCVSRRRVEDYDACPFLAGESAIQGMELVGTSTYCSTPDEQDLEKMCPYAQAMHPAFSSSGVPYPLARDEHLRRCDALNTGSAAEAPLVSIACCRIVQEYFEDATTATALQSLCNMDDCYIEFGIAFPQINLEMACTTVDPLVECKFDLQAGPSTHAINLGFVSEDCCVAAETHASNGDADALGVICEDVSCIKAYESLFQQGQAFTNPGSTDTLDDVCLARDAPAVEEAMTTGSSAAEIEGEAAAETITNSSQAEPGQEQGVPQEVASGTSRRRSFCAGALLAACLPIILSRI